MKICLALLIILYAQTVEAATRWVAPSGGLASGTCSTTETACTVAYAYSIAVNGTAEEFIFKDGTYASWTQLDVTKGGASDAVRWILRAENRRQAIIQPAADDSFLSVERSWITVRGFKIDGQRLNGSCMVISGTPAKTGIILEDNWCFDIGKLAFAIQTILDNVIIRFNTVESIGWRTDYAAPNVAENFYIGSTSASGSPATNIELYGNTMIDGHSQALDIKNTATNINIHHNIIENWSTCVAPVSCNDDSVGVLANTATTYQTAPNVLVQNNIWRDMLAWDHTGAELLYNQRYINFNNNVIHDLGSANWATIGRGSSTTPADFTNNTFCNTPSTISGAANTYDTTGSLFNQAQAVCDAEVTRITSEIAARPVIASAEIGLVAADKIRITWTNDKFPPLASVDNAKITCTVAGVARTVDSSTIVGTNITEHTLASAVTAGQAVICAGTLGMVVNSGRVGSSYFSDLADSAALTTGSGGVPSITNNVDGAPSTFNFATTAFQFYGIRELSDAVVKIPHAAAAVSTNVSVVPGANLILAVQIDCTVADCPPIGVIPYYQKNGAGGYAALTGSFGADNVRIGTSQVGLDVPNEGETVAACLSGALTPVNGLMVMTANAIPTFDMAQDGCVVNRWAIEFDTDATAGDYYDFRPYHQTTDALDTYTVTPRVTIIGDRAAGGAS